MTTINKRFQIWEACAKLGDYKPVLTCVLFDPGGYAVATDGFIMAVVRIADPPPKPALVPAQWLKDVAKAASSKDSPVKGMDEVVIDFDFEKGEAVWPVDHRSIPMRPMPETFPNWRGVLPTFIKRNDLPSTVALNSTLTLRLMKAIGKDVALGWWYHDGTGPSVLVAEDALGLQMPLWGGGETYKYDSAAWTSPPTATPTVEAAP